MQVPDTEPYWQVWVPALEGWTAEADTRLMPVTGSFWAVSAVCGRPGCQASLAQLPQYAWSV